MICLKARLLAAPIAVAASLALPLAAQTQPEPFTLPTATPTPSPAPAGPADERAGVAIPPRAQPTAQPSATPEPRPTASPRALATPILQPPPSPSPAQRAPEPSVGTGADGAEVDLPPLPPGMFDDGMSDNPQFVPRGAPQTNAPDPLASPELPAGTAPALSSALPAWWPYAAGGAGALALLLGGAAMLWRRRKPHTLHLAAPLAAAAAPDLADEQPRLDLTLEIIAATRSVMMFTVEYRLTIANRSQRAVTDVNAAVQLACARAGANMGAGNAASPGAAQSLAKIDRVGPHQARSITGQAQLPLSAIAPLRQGTAPLFIPLAHLTLEGSGLRALAKSFVIGTPSASGTGRVHPILLDQPPGAIPGLVAQPINIPPVSNSV